MYEDMGDDDFKEKFRLALQNAPILEEEIEKLKGEIATLKAENAVLKAENAALKAEITALKDGK